MKMFLPDSDSFVLTKRAGDKSSSVKSSLPIFSPNKDSFVFVRDSNNAPSLSTKSTKSKKSTKKSSPSVFSPNKDSFVLVKQSVTQLKPSGTNEKSSKKSLPMFSPNSESFLLIRQSFTEVNPSKSSKKDSLPMFSPNSESFLLVRQSVVDITPSSKSSKKDSLPMFSPNSESFLLVRQSVVDITPSSDKENEKVGTSKSTDLEESKINDKAKRKFLKTLGVVGAGVVASQLIPKKASALIMGSSPTTGVVGVKDSTNSLINPATEETLNEVLKTSDLTFDGGALEVKIAGVSGAGTSSFSDSGDVAKSALVDGDRHVQVDVLSSALPDGASTETTLETISYGGVKYALRLETVGDYDYIGEAAVGSSTSSSVWRIKRVDNTAGDITIMWADGDGSFDNIWDNRASLTYL